MSGQPDNEAHSRYKIALLVAGLLCTASVFINFYLYTKVREEQDKVTSLSNLTAGKSEYQLLSPMQKSPVEDDAGEGSRVFLHYSDLKTLAEKEISAVTPIENVGIFLQDSYTGAWMGINETMGFFPASLLKVPVMMAVLKKVENQELQFTEEVEIIPTDIDRASGNLFKQGAGTRISIWNLLQEMTSSSDNTAKNTLKRQLSDAELNAVFAHVGIPNPYKEGTEKTISPRAFTRVLKSLYYSTYLNRDLSQKALGLMTDTEVEELLSAGVPSDVQVAHKYGVSTNLLSDCGIVYYDDNHYFLCIMIKDTDTKKSSPLIVKLSKLFYGYISTQKEGSDSGVKD